MKIKAGNHVIESVRVHEERELIPRTPDTMLMDDRPVRRLSLSDGLTSEQIDALKSNPWTVVADDGAESVHKGFVDVLRHEIVFAGQDEQDAPLKAQIAALTAERDQVVEERDEYATRLTALPKQGEDWHSAKRYIKGDTALDGVMYQATGYSKGKRPSENPDCWERVPEAVKVTRWEDDTSGTAFSAGTLRTYDQDGDAAQRKTWRCKKPHTKSTIRRPMAISDYWEEVISR